MEPCPFEDAFPNIDTGSVHKRLTGSGSGFPYVGGTDSKATREERRAARKKAKKCKGPALDYSNLITGEEPGPPTDPDRPAVERMPEVEAMQGEQPHRTIPILPKASCLFSDPGTPSYFGKTQEDAEEGYAEFSSLVSDSGNYMLEPDVLKTFDGKGVAKAGGANLPEPNLVDNWKPMTPVASYTAYLKELPSVGASVPGWARDIGKARPAAGPMESPAEVSGDAAMPPPSKPVVVAAGGNPKEDRDMLLARIDALMGRLEQLEKRRTQDSQSEILLFVGTGLFMLAAFDFMSRR